MEKPLGFVANAVHEFLVEATIKEHFLGLIAWVEAHRPNLGLARIICDNTNEGPSFVVSSGQRFPKEKMNFGWRKVVFASYHFPWGGETGFVMPMPSPIQNGD
ncbi:shikimate O-hydroxycinnamoyltransferase [Spatholobus suberectus]|nr:shikimate O-hydroxycinnamoyltransferase [Spatholobus suberectus]